MMCEVIVFFIGAACAGLLLRIIILDNKIEDMKHGIYRD